MSNMQVDKIGCEGKIIEMGEKNKNAGSKSKNRQNMGKSVVGTIKKCIPEVLVAITIAYCGFIGVTIFSLSVDVAEIKGRLNTNSEVTSEKYISFNEKITGINEKLVDIEGTLNGVGAEDGIKTRMAVIEERLNLRAVNASEGATSRIQASIKCNNVNYVSAPSPISETEILGTDNDGNLLLAKDMIGQTVLVTYNEGTQEVYFLGQYNEDFQWNGNCIIHVYNQDGTLAILTDANYEAGEIRDYKQIMPDSGEWKYAERKSISGINVGETYTYDWIYEKEKNFTNTNVKGEDIISAEQFKSKMEGKLLSYYSGNTSDGKYNDDTGNAYSVKYSPDGTVRTLYVGGFKDGSYYDYTNTAWYIAVNEGTDYMFYKGFFDSGATVNNSDSTFLNPVKRDKVEEVLSMYEFKCPIKWDESKFSK